MRTRFLNKMTHYEAEEYIKRNDIIFVALGTTEVHGQFPANVETKTAEALALLMAEKVDGLVLSDLPYFYVGASPISPVTVKMSVEGGYKYIKEIAHSLLAQGFRRQIYVSFHGPSFLTAGAMLVDFFDETKVPISYIDCVQAVKYVNEKYGIAPLDKEGKLDYDQVFYGTYDILNIKDELVVDPDILIEPKVKEKTKTLLDHWDYMRRYAHPSGSVGFYFVEPYDHAGMTGAFHTVEERDETCAKGAAYLRELIDHMELENYVDALRQIDDQTVEVMDKYGRLLPDNKYPYRKK